MDALAYSYARQHLAEVMDRVNNNREPVLITRQGGKAVVMLSLDDYNALEETAYLLRRFVGWARSSAHHAQNLQNTQLRDPHTCFGDQSPPTEP